MLGFVRVVLFTFIFPSVGSEDLVDASSYVYQAASLLAGNVYPVAVGASLLLPAKVKALGAVGEVVLDGKMIPNVSINGICSSLSSSGSGRAYRKLITKRPRHHIQAMAHHFHNIITGQVVVVKPVT